MLASNLLNNHPTTLKRCVGSVSLVVMFALLCLQPSVADAKDIRWTELNLSPQQLNELERYESEWRRLYMDVSPQIQRDSVELKNLMDDPHGDAQRLMELQSRINDNKQRLQNEAMKTFLKKREKLSPEQRMILQRQLAH